MEAAMPVAGASTVSSSHTVFDLHHMGAAAETLLVMCCIVAMIGAASSAEDKPSSSEYLDVPTGRYDLLRAHSERVVVIFGQEITFKKYVVVKILEQYFTLGVEVPGDGRYTLHDDGKEKTLVIY
jgi:hypothetical protein